MTTYIKQIHPDMQAQVDRQTKTSAIPKIITMDL